MTRERIDNFTEAVHLRDDYDRPKIHRVRPNDEVGAAPAHGVAGTGMNGIEVQLDALAQAQRELGVLQDKLLGQLDAARGLTDELRDGGGPIAAKMRRTFLQLADAEGGVQTTLTEYMAELFDMRIVMLQTLASYQRVDDDAVAELNRQIATFEEAN